jgi:ABC-type glycerol-3-phosphate transport system substrate-binding protein
VPAAGVLAGTAAAAPRIRVGELAQPFAGVTLTFAKAPHGNDEKDVVAKLLAPFEQKTGIKIVHTIVPWNVEGATYATNYAGPNPFDVSYQTSTDLTGLGTKGVLEVLNGPKWFNAPSSTASRASSAARSSTTPRTCWRRPV